MQLDGLLLLSRKEKLRTKIVVKKLEANRFCGKNRKKSEMKKAPETGAFLVAAGEIFVRYTEEHFPLLLGREVRLFL